MVSGFVTSPCDQLRIFSGEARLMRIASKSAIVFAISKGLERYKVSSDSCGPHASADGPRKSAGGMSLWGCFPPKSSDLRCESAYASPHFQFLILNHDWLRRLGPGKRAGAKDHPPILNLPQPPMTASCRLP